jgi:hypothetical protein
MNHPPRTIDGARLVRWSAIDDRHRPTGSSRQIVAGIVQGAAAGLAICQYEGETAYYLFGCDSEWNPVTDTWHETLDDALKQAEFEYEGVSSTWRVV